MPLSAPDVETLPANFKRVTLRFIDSTGDNRAVSADFNVAATNAQIQAWAEAEGAASNANLWEIQVSSVWSAGAAQKSLADDDEYSSVFDNIVILYGGSLNHSERTFIPAPLEALLVDGTDEPDTANALFTAVMNTFNTLLDAGTEDFVPKSVRFTERKDKNEAVKL